MIDLDIRVIDLDIRVFFDTVPHDLVLKAVAHHTDQRWIGLYVQHTVVLDPVA